MAELTRLIVNPEFLLSLFLAIAVFATIITIFWPMLSFDRTQSRMNQMVKERDTIRARERARMIEEAQKGSIRDTPKGYMKDIVDRFRLDKAVDQNVAAEQLQMAGHRGQSALVAYMFFTLVVPVIVFVLAFLYLNFINNFGHGPMMRIMLAFLAAIVGFYLPKIIVKNMIQKRKQIISRNWPDALDLLLICVESGMSIEAAFRKVATEISNQCIPLAEELTLTTAELSYLPDRRTAYDNLGKRTGIEAVKSAGTSLVQSEKYGTPIGQALRTLADQSRSDRMMAAEKKAAALPPKLTVPMILFFLPVLFVVILGPAAMKVMALD